MKAILLRRRQFYRFRIIDPVICPSLLILVRLVFTVDVNVRRRNIHARKLSRCENWLPGRGRFVTSMHEACRETTWGPGPRDSAPGPGDPAPGSRSPDGGITIRARAARRTSASGQPDKTQEKRCSTDQDSQAARATLYCGVPATEPDNPIAGLPSASAELTIQFGRRASQ